MPPDPFPDQRQALEGEPVDVLAPLAPPDEEPVVSTRRCRLTAGHFE
ncbi:MAG: hypothetical protein LC780_02755 [Acidobacteria bacterium]|nr:hypothetical protein [Acidobacteriota bacterium]